MTQLNFDSFTEWQSRLNESGAAIWEPVIQYESIEKGRPEDEVWAKIAQAYAVMKDAVHTGLTEDMQSYSGMINNGAKKVRDAKIEVLGPDFKRLVYQTLAAKEVNSCMGRVVAAPTAGASGIMPGILITLQQQHKLEDGIIYQSMLVAAGVALIIEKRASIAGAVGGCQAETGTAAAMGAAAIVYALGGNMEQVCTAVAITIMNMLGLICDPVAGLVEVPCVKRNASGAVIAFAAAQMALADYDPVIPVDQVVDVMGEVGQSMKREYKETALGGLATTPKGKEIAEKVLINEAEIIEAEEGLKDERFEENPGHEG